MPEVVNSALRMFADDAKILREVDSKEDTEFTIKIAGIKRLGRHLAIVVQCNQIIVVSISWNGMILK